jgi:hypothetical protein
MEKKWFKSKTIWGILIGGLGFLITEVLKVPDTQLPPNADFEQLKVYAESIKAAQGNVGVLIGQLMGIVGAIVGIIGRVKADGKLV